MDSCLIAQARIVSAMLIIVWASPMHAQVYRSENNGEVTYADRVPSPARDAGHSILNNQGVVLDRVLSRDERLQQALAEKLAKAKATRDRTLLATFTRENDLIRTRDDRLSLIDNMVDIMDGRMLSLHERLETVDRRIELQERNNDTGVASRSLYSERDRIERRMEQTLTSIDERTLERQKMAIQFEKDLIRYRELKAKR